MGFLIQLLSGGVLGRVFDSVDKHIAGQADKERIKGELLQEYMRTRGDYMRAGGIWLMLLFAVPLAVYHASVLVYSMLWCSKCAFPQQWVIAALPPPFGEWAGLMIVSIFGVVGLSRLK